MPRVVIWYVLIFWNLNKSEKLSEIKPPLVVSAFLHVRAQKKMDLSSKTSSIHYFWASSTSFVSRFHSEWFHEKKSSSWKSEWVHYARDSRFESRNLNWYSYYKVRVFWEGYKHLVQSSYWFWRYYFVAFSEHIYFKFNFQCCLCWGDLVEFSNFLFRILCIP